MNITRDIKLTDIFNINITNNKKQYNKDYIIIEINNDSFDEYLEPINQYNGVFIYKLKKNNKLSNYFNKANLNLDDYVELGHYIIYNTSHVKILLINKNNTIVTNRYTLLDTVGQLYIWKPMAINNNYTNLGIVCTSNPSEIPSDYIGLIPKKYIKLFNASYDQLFQSDYSLLGSNRDNKKKILTYSILNTNNNTDYDSDNENDDYNITNPNKKHKSRKIEHFTSDEDDNNGYSSKSIVLVENDNPWYVNKKDTIPVKYISNDNYFGYRKSPEDASFDSQMVLDASLPSMGMGYSYASRQNVIKNVENMEGKPAKDNSNYIIILLFVAIAILLFYKMYYKKKHTNKH